MSEQNDLIITQSKVASTFFHFVMHRFEKQSKAKVAEGNCLVLQYQPEGSLPQYYIKMNNYEHLKLVTNSVFFKMAYARSTSYLFFDEGNNEVVYAISGMNNSVDIQILEAFLKKQAVIQDYGSDLSYEKKVRIDYHAFDIAQNQIIINFNKSSKIAQTLGAYFGKVQKTITIKAHKTQKIIQEKIQKVSKESFSEATVEKWNSLKNKAVQINQKLTSLFMPINQSIQNVVSNIGQQYNGSTNQYIVTFRQFSRQTSSALNEGVRTQNAVQQSKQQAQSNVNIQASNAQRAAQQGVGSNPYPVLEEIV